jgi:hypothetical protein
MFRTTTCLKFHRSAKFLNYNYPFSAPFPEDSCWSMVMVDGGCDPYYIKGLGGPFYDCPAIILWYTYIQEVVYFKKGTETWGTPLSCDSLQQVGIAEIAVAKEVNIYPNPTSGIITASVPTNAQIPCKLEIFDNSGRFLGIYTLSQQTQSFDLSDIPAGLYNYKVTTAEGDIFRGKIIRH